MGILPAGFGTPGTEEEPRPEADGVSRSAVSICEDVEFLLESSFDFLLFRGVQFFLVGDFKSFSSSWTAADCEFGSCGGDPPEPDITLVFLLWRFCTDCLLAAWLCCS